MSSDYNLADLERWNEKILPLVESFGLDIFSQEFEICDHDDMLSYMVYSGMPSHYPHWSYGKNFEKLKTLYEYGVSGLPYEMVINSNPSIAYLMRDNSLALQILTIAHVYGHNDFFKNNFTFRSTRAEYTIETFKSHANRIRHYVEDPSIGLERVEAVLDAAHALSLQCRRNLAIKKPTAAEERAMKMEELEPPVDPFSAIHRRKEQPAPDLNKVPLYPDEDLLIFIRDHNPQLAEWEKDLLTIIQKQAQYFVPQIETKIMNEGWASFWHKRIVEALELPQGLHMEFIIRHTQVLRPSPGSLNPYHVGMKIWEDIEKRWNNPAAEDIAEFGARTKNGRDKLFEVREVERDASFLRRYLTEELIRELNLFEYKNRGSEQVVSRVADEDNWRQIKETLIQNVGTATIPVIKVEDSDYLNNRTLLLKHHHDGRDLQLEYAERTLKYVHQLWGHDVVMDTILDNHTTLLTYSDGKFAVKKAA
jgi:stage V sporulation protein R